MKTFLIVTVILSALACSSVVSAQGVCPLNVFEENNNPDKSPDVVAMIMQSGSMHNEMGKIVVELVNSRVYNNVGHKIGHMTNYKVFDNRGRLLGTMSSTGVMKSKKGRFLGRLDNDGLVRSRAGEPIYYMDGYIHGVPQCRKFIMAYIFFFRDRN